MKKNILLSLVLLLAIGGAFYGGLLYGQKNKKSLSNFSKMSGDDQRAMMSGARQNGGRNGGANGGMIAGSLLSQDDESLTVKLMDGGSKIVFLSETTQILKMASSSKEQLAVGDNLMVNGTNNADGSVVASMVQIRPEMGPGFNQPKQ